MTNASRIRALVVDDEPLAREMIREMLEDDPDVEIVGECANGREAIEAIKSSKPDLVFLDIQMPEFGGFEVLESLDRQTAPTSSSSRRTINMLCARSKYTPSTTYSSLSITRDSMLPGSV